MPRILDGNRVRDEIMNDLKPRVAALAAKGRLPGLAVVLVGHNPASEIYVRNKIKACRDLGIHSESITPPDSISTEELLAVVEGLNARVEIDGILVQLPLPRQVDSKRILLAVSPAKDVDGFHPCNVGRLVAGLPVHAPTRPRALWNCSSVRGLTSQASAPWWWAAAISSASPSPCCCCTITPP